MLKKVLLAIFGAAILFQAAVVSLWNTWITQQAGVERLSYIAYVSGPHGFAVGGDGQIYVAGTEFTIYQNGQVKQSYSENEIGLNPSLVSMDPFGRVWVTSYRYSDGASVFDGQRWVHIAGLREATIHDLEVDSTGRVWTATSAGLYMYDNQKWHEFNTSNSQIGGDFVTDLSADQEGRVWVVAYKDEDVVNGVVSPTESIGFITLTDGVVWDDFGGNAGNTGGIWDIQADPNGGLWAALSNGLNFFDGKQWTLHTPNIPALQGESAENPALDSQSRVWVWYDRLGAYVFDGSAWRYAYKSNYGSLGGIRAGLDGNIYIISGNQVHSASAEIRLLNRFENGLKRAVDDGKFIYLTTFLIGVWLMAAFNAWGVGLGLLGGGLAYLVFLAGPLPSLGVFFNPGFYTTVGGILGGLVGRSFRRPEGTLKHADLWGSGIGCGGLFLLTSCLAMFLLIFGAR